MNKVKELVKDIKEHKKKFAITENSTLAEKIRYKISHGKKSETDWLALQDEVIAYLATNPPQEEKDILFSCCEMVGMVCERIESRRRNRGTL